MEKIKQKYAIFIENGLIFIVFSLLVMFWLNTSQTLNYDLAWCFHISQKVASGYSLYSEISTVVTPLYFWFGALFVKIFGNYLFVMHIYAGVVWGIISVTLYNILKLTVNKKSNLLFPLFSIFILQYSFVLSMSNYNSFAVMWWMLAVYFEIKRELDKPNENKQMRYNILIGTLLGLVFFSKQNVGFFAVVATGIISILKWFMSRKNNIKEILSKAAGFLFVTLLMLIYFIFTNTFISFLEFCFGGLFEFGKENLHFGFDGKYLFLTIVIMIAVLFAKEKKDNILIIEVIVQIALCGLTYPLTNGYHVILSMLISMPIIFRLMNYFIEKKLMYYIWVALFIFWAILTSSSFSKGEYINIEKIMLGEGVNGIVFIIMRLVIAMIIGISIATEKFKMTKIMTWIVLVIFLVSTMFIHKENVKNEYVADGLEVYKNLGLSKIQLGYIEEIIDYILEKEAEGYNVYVISADASYYMMALERNNYKFDLTLYGSLGIDGEDGLIEDVSKLQNALLLKNSELMHQEPEKFDKYIKENYEAVDYVGEMIVYSAL